MQANIRTAIRTASRNGFAINWRHDAGGINLEPVHWGPDTTDDEIEKAVAEADADAAGHRGSAIKYWTAARDASRASREHIARARALLARGEEAAAHAAYEAAAAEERRFRDRPTFPRVDAPAKPSDGDEDHHHWLGAGRRTPAGQAWEAVCSADHDALQRILGEHGREATIETPSILGHPVTPLTAAAKRGDTLATKMLLDAGADPQARASGHMIASPTAWAIEARSLACVRMLIERGVRETDGEDWSFIAVNERDHIMNPIPEILLALLAGPADPSADALEKATKVGDQQAMEALLAYGADPDARGTIPAASPPMAHALRHPGSNDRDTIGPRVLRTLLAYGADPDAKCGPIYQHAPPAMVAAVEAGAWWAIPILRKAGADTTAATRYIERYEVRTGSTQPMKNIVQALRLLAMPNARPAP